MKLLIVDDEELTRTGVISSLDWKSLGIDEVLQADDGVHGLEAARLHRPEIILCDVRMPRMDGITMLERLENQFLREKQFSSDAAHELRTPVASILLHCEYVLEEKNISDEVKEELTIIKNKTLLISKLVTQLLIIARTENEKAGAAAPALRFRPEPAAHPAPQWQDSPHRSGCKAPPPHLFPGLRG